MSQTPAHVTTCEVRLAFPALFEPRPPIKGDTSGDLSYQATLLLPPDTDLKPFHAAMRAAAVDKFGAKMPKFAASKNPIKSYDDATTPFNGLLPGWHFIRTKTRFQPSVVDQRLQPVLDPRLVFSGCWVRALIHAYGWSHPTGGKGISFGLDALQFIRSDERLDGRIDASKVFEAVEFDAADLGAQTTEDAGVADAEAMFG